MLTHTKSIWIQSNWAISTKQILFNDWVKGWICSTFRSFFSAAQTVLHAERFILQTLADLYLPYSYRMIQTLVHKSSSRPFNITTDEKKKPENTKKRNHINIRRSEMSVAFLYVFRSFFSLSNQILFVHLFILFFRCCCCCSVDFLFYSRSLYFVHIQKSKWSRKETGIENHFNFFRVLSFFSPLPLTVCSLFIILLFRLVRKQTNRAKKKLFDLILVWIFRWLKSAHSFINWFI